MATHYVTINADLELQRSLGIHPGDRFEVRRSEDSLILSLASAELENAASTTTLKARTESPVADWRAKMDEIRALYPAKDGLSSDEILAELDQEWRERDERLAR